MPYVNVGVTVPIVVENKPVGEFEGRVVVQITNFGAPTSWDFPAEPCEYDIVDFEVCHSWIQKNIHNDKTRLEKEYLPCPDDLRDRVWSYLYTEEGGDYLDRCVQEEASELAHEVL